MVYFIKHKELTVMTRNTVLLKSAAALAFVLCVIYAIIKTSGDQIAPAQSVLIVPSMATVPSNSEKADESTQELIVLREQVDLLRAELNSLRQQTLNATNTSSPTSNVNEPGDSRRDASAMADAEVAHRAQMTVVESGFRNELRNPQWADGTSTQIREALSASQIPQENLRDIDCRSNTCRVEILNKGDDDLMKSLPLVINQLGTTLPSMTADQLDQGNGISTTVLYFSGVQ
jgi:hypothetical protein